MEFDAHAWSINAHLWNPLTGELEVPDKIDENLDVLYPTNVYDADKPEEQPKNNPKYHELKKIVDEVVDKIVGDEVPGVGDS